MGKEIISDKQGIFLIAMSLVGTSSMLSVSGAAKKDVWLAILIAMLMTLPLVLIYARLHTKFPGKNLFDIFELLLGKYLGKFLVVTYILFIFHNTVLILLNTVLFIQKVSLLLTPLVITTIIICILCIWSVKDGIELLGRWATFFFPILFIIIIMSIFLLIPRMDINNLDLKSWESFNSIMHGSFQALTFPFAETILVFSFFFSDFKSRKSPYKIYLYGFFIGGFLLFSLTLSNILVLGPNKISTLYYPSYISLRLLRVGDTLQRIEVVTAIVFVLGAFLKISVFLFVTCKGMAKIINVHNYRFIITPVALLLICFTLFIHNGVVDFFRWLEDVWLYYSLIFQAIIPIIIFIIAEMKNSQALHKSA